MRENILRFFTTDPVIAWLMVGAVCLVIACVGMVVHGRRETRRQDEERARLNRIIAANRESKLWQPPPPGPKGGPWRGGRAA